MAAAVGAILSRLEEKLLELDRLKHSHHIAGRGSISLAKNSVGTVGGNLAGCPVGTVALAQGQLSLEP